MANPSTLLHYARLGAAARIKELQDEIANIRKAFPGSRGDSAAVRRKPGRRKAQTAAPAPAATESTAAPAAQPKRKRRKMSAAARKAIGDAQRRRWAKVKKARANK